MSVRDRWFGIMGVAIGALVTGAEPSFGVFMGFVFLVYGVFMYIWQREQLEVLKEGHQ